VPGSPGAAGTWSPGSRGNTDTARELAQELDAQADELKRRARALYAYADALGDEPDTDGFEPRPVQGYLDMDSVKRPRRRRPAASPSNKRPLIAKLIAGRPTPGWSPAEVHSELIDRELIPPETTKASINVTLRRMYVEHGELGKTPDGLYTTLERGEPYAEAAD
jgi:hypothetical protein